MSTSTPPGPPDDMVTPSVASGENRRRKRDQLRELLGAARPFFRRRSKSSGPPGADDAIVGGLVSPTGSVTTLPPGPPQRAYTSFTTTFSPKGPPARSVTTPVTPPGVTRTVTHTVVTTYTRAPAVSPGAVAHDQGSTYRAVSPALPPVSPAISRAASTRTVPAAAISPGALPALRPAGGRTASASIRSISPPASLHRHNISPAIQPAVSPAQDASAFVRSSSPLAAQPRPSVSATVPPTAVPAIAPAVAPARDSSSSVRSGSSLAAQSRPAVSPVVSITPPPTVPPAAAPVGPAVVPAVVPAQDASTPVRPSPPLAAQPSPAASAAIPAAAAPVAPAKAPAAVPAQDSSSSVGPSSPLAAQPRPTPPAAVPPVVTPTAPAPAAAPAVVPAVVPATTPSEDTGDSVRPSSPQVASSRPTASAAVPQKAQPTASVPAAAPAVLPARDNSAPIKPSSSSAAPSRSIVSPTVSTAVPQTVQTTAPTPVVAPVVAPIAAPVVAPAVGAAAQPAPVPVVAPAPAPAHAPTPAVVPAVVPARDNSASVPRTVPVAVLPTVSAPRVPAAVPAQDASASRPNTSASQDTTSSEETSTSQYTTSSQDTRSSEAASPIVRPTIPRVSAIGTPPSTQSSPISAATQDTNTSRDTRASQVVPPTTQPTAPSATSPPNAHAVTPVPPTRSPTRDTKDTSTLKAHIQPTVTSVVPSTKDTHDASDLKTVSPTTSPKSTPTPTPAAPARSPARATPRDTHDSTPSHPPAPRTVSPTAAPAISPVAPVRAATPVPARAPIRAPVRAPTRQNSTKSQSPVPRTISPTSPLAITPGAPVRAPAQDAQDAIASQAPAPRTVSPTMTPTPLTKAPAQAAVPNPVAVPTPPTQTAEEVSLNIPQRESLRIWGAAYQQLKSSDKTASLVAKYESILGQFEPVAAPLLDNGAMTKRLQAMDIVVKRAGTSNYGGKPAEVGDGSLAVLGLVRGTVAELAAANPVASFAWAGFCVIAPNLLAPITENKPMGDGLAHLSDRLKWYMALVQLLLAESWKDDDQFDDLRSEIDARVTRLYRKLLEFEMRCVCAYVSPRTAAAKYLVSWNGWSNLLQSIKDSEASLHSEINQYSTEAVKEYLNTLVTTSGQTLGTQQEAVESSRAAEDIEMEKVRNETIRKFQVVNYGDCFNDVPARVQGTCEWIEKDDAYRRWVASENGESPRQRPRDRQPSPSAKAAPKVLNISAGPGWGKSVLARFMVETRLPADLGAGHTICHYFFRYDQPGMNSATNALHSIIHQLLCQQRELADVVENRLKQLGSGAMGTSNLVEILLDAVSSPKARPVVCVIDALDECLPDQLVDIVYLLKQARSHNIRFLLNTRPWQHILQTLREELQEGNLETISAETFKQRDISHREIELVLNHNLKTLEDRFDEETRLKVQKKLLSTSVDRAERTFLWLKLVHESVKKVHLKEDVDKLLRKPPATLYDAYDLLLSRVKPERRQMFSILLNLVLVSERPLSVKEASTAVWLRLHPKTRSLAQFDPDGAAAFQSWVAETGGGFVHVSEGRLYFLHQTCRGYLLRKPNSKPGDSGTVTFASSTTEALAHATAAECCLLSLLLRPFPPVKPGSESALEYDGSESPDPGADNTHAGSHENNLAGYAAAYLTHHFNLCQRYEAGSEALVDIDASLRPIYTWLFRRYLLSEGCCLKVVDPRVLCDKEAGPEKVAERYLLVLRHIPAFFNDPLRLGYGESRPAQLSSNPVFIVLSNESMWSPKTPPTMQAAGVLTGSLLLFQAERDAGNLERTVQPVDIVGHGEYSEPVPAITRYYAKQSTPLFRAAAMDSAHIVRWILASGVKLSGTDRHGDGNTVLHAAVRQPFAKSQSDTLKVLLEAGADPKAANDRGLKPITCAAAWQNWPAVRLLLARGADPSGADGHHIGTTPLLSAVRYQRAHGGDLNAIKMLLEAGAGPNGGTQPPLAGATPEVMSLLLEAGARGGTGEDNGHDTALHALMCQLGDKWLRFQPQRITKLIHDLVKAGCPADGHGAKGITPLQTMFVSTPSGGSLKGVQQGPYPFVQCIDTLCELGADVNSRSKKHGRTALHFACIVSIPEHELGPVFQALARHGADFGARDSAGDTALHALSWRPGEDSCEKKAGRARSFLQTVLPDPTKADLPAMEAASDLVNARNRRGQTALHLICLERTPDQDMLEWCQTLLAWGADAKGRDMGGNPLLHSLVINPHAYPAGGPDRSDLDDVLDLLISRGPGSGSCDAVNARDGRGRTALHVACEKQSSIDAALKWSRELLGRGADADIRDAKGGTALHSLAQRGRIDDAPITFSSVAGLLSSRGAGLLEARDAHGRTALHLVCSSVQQLVILRHRAHTLLGLGADADARDDVGASPLHALANNAGLMREFRRLPQDGLDDVVKLLVSRGANLGAKDREGRTFFDYMLEVGPKFAGIYRYSKAAAGGRDAAVELLASRGAAPPAPREGQGQGRPSFQHRLEVWHDGVGKTSNWGEEDEDSSLPQVDRWLFDQKEYLDWRREHFPQLPVTPPQ
ncbi:hypothetical protein RB601_008662 [Gaeumannomyces tritici]